MKPVDDAEDVLKAIETALIETARRNAGMNNYTAMRAYDAAIEHYRDIARQQMPKEVRFSGLDALAYQAVQDACEQRLSKPISNHPNAAILSPEDLVACLRRLRKSVDFWTKQGGRTGYLEHVSRFV